MVLVVLVVEGCLVSRRPDTKRRGGFIQTQRLPASSGDVPSPHPHWRVSVYRAGLWTTPQRMVADKGAGPVAVEAEQRDFTCDATAQSKRTQAPNSQRKMHLQSCRVAMGSSARNGFCRGLRHLHRLHQGIVRSASLDHHFEPSLLFRMPRARPLFPMQMALLHLRTLGIRALTCGLLLRPMARCRGAHAEFFLSSRSHLTLARAMRGADVSARSHLRPTPD